MAKPMGYSFQEALISRFVGTSLAVTHLSYDDKKALAKNILSDPIYKDASPFSRDSIEFKYHLFGLFSRADPKFPWLDSKKTTVIDPTSIVVKKGRYESVYNGNIYHFSIGSAVHFYDDALFSVIVPGKFQLHTILDGVSECTGGRRAADLVRVALIRAVSIGLVSSSEDIVDFLKAMHGDLAREGLKTTASMVFVGPGTHKFIKIGDSPVGFILGRGGSFPDQTCDPGYEGHDMRMLGNDSGYVPPLVVTAASLPTEAVLALYSDGLGDSSTSRAIASLLQRRKISKGQYDWNGFGDELVSVLSQGFFERDGIRYVFDDVSLILVSK